jgi:hypothetical protein
MARTGDTPHVELSHLPTRAPTSLEATGAGTSAGTCLLARQTETRPVIQHDAALLEAMGLNASGEHENVRIMICSESQGSPYA